MDASGNFASIKDVDGLAPDDLFKIYNDLSDYVCVHRAELDQYGTVVDARLRAWNRAYEAVRTAPVRFDQSVCETYFEPDVALDHINRAWTEGVARQVFDLTPATRDRYRPEGAVVHIDVLWQRVGDFIVEVGHDLSEVRALQLQLADQESAATAALHARVVAEERERIARDLHDSAIQQLFASALQLSTLSDTMPEGVQRNTVTNVAQMISNVISEIRDEIVAVRSVLPSSLQRELEDVVNFVTSPVGVNWAVTVSDEVDVEGEIRSNLRVAARESVTNSVRHGHVAHVVVQVFREGYFVVLRVSDDGVGFPTDFQRSSGITNLRRRAEGLGGSMTLSDGIDGGAVLEWRVPLPVGKD